MKSLRLSLILIATLYLAICYTTQAKTVIINANQGTENQIKQASPGDTILLAPGNHNRFWLTLDKGSNIVSTECDPLVIMSQDENNPAVIENDVRGWTTFWIDNSEYVIVENLIIQHGTTGMRIESSDHVIVRDCEIRYVRNAGLKIRDGSNYIDFVNNKIHHTGHDPDNHSQYSDTPWYGEGIYIGTAQGGIHEDYNEYLWIEGNEIYETGYGEGIDVKSHIHHLTIKGNYIHGISPGYEDKQANEAAISIASGDDIAPAEFWIEENVIENVTWGGGNPSADQVHGAAITTFGGGHYILNNIIGDAPEAGINLKDLYYRAGWMNNPFFIYEYGNIINNNTGPDYRGPGDLTPFMTYADPGFSNPYSSQSWCGDPGGNGSGPTGTIIYANQATQPQIDAASPGDTLLFESGVHDKISLNGIIATECAPLVLMSLNPNDPAKIFESNINGGKGIHIFESEYIIVDNLLVEGALYGIDVQHSEYIVVKNCQVMNTGQEGTKTRDRSRHIDWINNKIHDTGTRPNFSGYGECMYIGTGSYANSMFSDADSTAFVWIENNEIYNCGNGEAVELKPWVRNSTVKGNVIYNIVPGTSYQTNEGALVVWGSSDKPGNNWIENNNIDNVTWGETGGSGLVSFGGGNYLLNNMIGDCEEAAIYFNGYNDPGNYVYEWNSTINNTTGDDYKGLAQLDDLRQQDPGYSNPHVAQTWCVGASNNCPKPNLGDSQSLCGVGTIDLDAELMTNGVTTFEWFLNGVSQGSASTSTNTLTINQPGTWLVKIDSSIECSNTSEVVITNSVGEIDLGDDIQLCETYSDTITAGSSNSNLNYAWRKDGQLLSETMNELIVSESGTYIVTITGNGCATFDDTVFVSSSLPIATGDTICGPGMAAFSANGSGTIYWYDAMTNGTLQHTGGQFQTNIIQTTTYYAQGGETSTNYSTGRTNYNSVYTDNAYADKAIKFTIDEELVLHEVSFEASGPQTVYVNIFVGSTFNGASLLQTYSKQTIGGVDQIDLEITLQPGTYFMSANGTTGSLYLDNTVDSYEAAGIDGLITFATEPAWEATIAGPRWRYFYDWKISVGSACVRVPVEAVIDPNKLGCIITDLDESKQQSFEVYPSPVQDMLYFSEVSEYVIFNTFGGVEKQGEAKAVDVSDVNSGVYYISTPFGVNKIIKN